MTAKRQDPHVQEQRIHVIATQHLDVAYLWKRHPDGEALMKRCFERAIEMIEAYPEIRFLFSRSTAWSFYIVERNYPDLFEKISKYVHLDRIELCGGQWVEPDNILPDGETLARQGLYGQTYFESRFGKRASVGWNQWRRSECVGRHALADPQHRLRSEIRQYAGTVDG